MKWIKRIVVTLVIVFAAFYLVTQPVAAADAVRGVVVAVGNGIGSVFTFFTALAG